MIWLVGLFNILAALQVVVEDNGRSHTIDGGFVAALIFFHPGVEHGPVGEYGGETLVEKFHRDVGKFLAQSGYAGPDIAHGVGFVTVNIAWKTHDYSVNAFPGNVGFDKLHKARRFNGAKACAHNAQKVSDGDSTPPSSVIDC